MLPTNTPAAGRLCLAADTAADLMSPNPISIRATATVQQAVELLAGKAMSAAPVIDEAGRPVGVISRADVLRHDASLVNYLRPAATEGATVADEGLAVAGADYARVADLMNPAVFTVAPTTAVADVVRSMVVRNVHRLFVVDGTGVLIGVICVLDVLRHLRAMGQPARRPAAEVCGGEL